MKKNIKTIISNAFALEVYISAYNSQDQDKKSRAYEKFKAIWGTYLANHFLNKYDNAEDLIWALDEDNLNLFIEKF